MSLLEISDVLKGIDFQNRKSWSSSALSSINAGLYLMLLDNSDGPPIKDKNKIKNAKMIGKVVVPENSMAIKFGKFENGLIDRMKGYSKHLHHPDQIDGVLFPKVLAACYCLDLSAMNEKLPSFNSAAIYENFWNKSLDFYFSQNDLLHKDQNIRSEYRVVNHQRKIDKDNFINKRILDSINTAIQESFSIFSGHFKKEM